MSHQQTPTSQPLTHTTTHLPLFRLPLSSSCLVFHPLLLSQGIFFLIFFAFFGHFLHSLFPLYMHFPLCFPLLLLCLFQHVWPISLSNLILVILSHQTKFTFFSIFFPSFLRSHTRGQDKRSYYDWGPPTRTTRSYQQGSIDKETYTHESSEALRSPRLPLPHRHWSRPSPPRWTSRFRIAPEPFPHHWEAFLNQCQLTISQDD